MQTYVCGRAKEAPSVDVTRGEMVEFELDRSRGQHILDTVADRENASAPPLLEAISRAYQAKAEDDRR